MSMIPVADVLIPAVTVNVALGFDYVICYPYVRLGRHANPSHVSSLDFRTCKRRRVEG